jgi:hypothetical protein
VEEQMGQNSKKLLSSQHVSMPNAGDKPKKVGNDQPAGARSKRTKPSTSNNNKENRNRLETQVSAGRRDETLSHELSQDDAAAAAGSNVLGGRAEDDASRSTIEEIGDQDPLSLEDSNRTSTPKKNASHNKKTTTAEMSHESITVGHQMIDIQTGLVVVMSDTTTCADSRAVDDEEESPAGENQRSGRGNPSDGRVLEGKYKKIWAGCLKEIREIVKKYQNSVVSNFNVLE